MKRIIVRLLPIDEVNAADVPAIMDAAGVAFEPIDCVNWSESHPYRPKAEFRIAHNGGSLLLHYRVSESTVRAVAEQDGGRVWEDSCCEFFFSPAADGLYYNVESNCAATILLAVGESRANREKASGETMAKICRWTSLGRQHFEEKPAPEEWQMALVIPKEVFFHHSIRTFSGLEGRANFYKCGDRLAVPHFLSWSPIVTDTPDFHRPEFFGILIFE